MRKTHLLPLLAALLLTATPARARDRLGEFFADPFRVSTLASYAVTTMPTNNLLDQHLNLNQVVSRSDTAVWRVFTRLGEFNATGLLYPSTYWDIEAGASFSRKLEGRRELTLRASVGSASDEPFNSLHETALSASAFYRVPAGEQNAWIFALLFSNNRSFANNIPIPGVAYLIADPAQGLSAIFGLPFAAVNYKNADTGFGARASYFFPLDLSAEVSQQVVRGLRAFAGFEWSQQAWLRANRVETNQRLYFDSRAGTAGLRAELLEGLTLEVSGGYSFGRRIFEATSVLKPKATVQDLSPTPVAGAQLSFKI